MRCCGTSAGTGTDAGTETGTGTGAGAGTGAEVGSSGTGRCCSVVRKVVHHSLSWAVRDQ
ncbi:hypothetical protein EAO76_15370 [Streptomyces sp. sk2.1]|nr:hypothetical protein EAO76_15370 [Streptomyces sp. sk2.1]